MDMQTDTAHQAWNTRWTTADGRAAWLVPEQDVVDFAARLKAERGRVKALDLGCGVGRHALHFARLGFETAAVDLAEAGLAELRAAAEAEALEIDVRRAAMNALPFPDAAFDYVLSFNVIHHGDEAVVISTLAEIRRILPPGGHFQGTLLSKRNRNYGKGREIAPNTFVIDGDEDDDKRHPHYYCNAAELVAMFRGFELLSLEDRVHAKPGSWHWHVIAERRAGD